MSFNILNEHFKIQIWAGTFNVNGKDPPESLEQWILCDQVPDVIVVGFQVTTEIMKTTSGFTFTRIFKRIQYATF